MEVKMRTKVVKWGNSLGLRIPKSFAKEVQVSEGSEVDLSMQDGQLIIRAIQPTPIRLEDLLKDITDSNIHAEIETGDVVGNEYW